MNREILEKKFTGKEIKTRKGSFGNMIDYVDIQLIIQRLNDAFDGKWNFEVIDHQIQQTEVIVLGKLSAEDVHKSQFGSNKITVSKAGEVVSIGDDLKAATSDSLKKCASMFGVGLHIYGDSLPEQPADKGKKSNPNPAPPKQKTEPASTTNGIDKQEKEGNIPTAEQKIKELKKEFYSQDTIKAMNPEQIDKWCLEYIGTYSADIMTLHDWLRASELARMQSNPIKFNVTDRQPDPQQDEKRLERLTKAYFASLPNRLKDDAIRHQWQRDNIQKGSTKTWTEQDFETALDMIEILNKEIAEQADPDIKKELPKIDTGLRESNGGSSRATEAQLKFIQKLFEKKGYYTNQDVNTWTKGRAICTIEFLQKQ